MQVRYLDRDSCCCCHLYAFDHIHTWAEDMSEQGRKEVRKISVAREALSER